MADVVVTSDGQCRVPNLEAIRTRARADLSETYADGYSNFPIDRHALLEQTVNTMFTEDSICLAVSSPLGADGTDHNRVRNYYKSHGLTETEAGERGVFTRRIPFTITCDGSWKPTDNYVDVDDCEDLKDIIDGQGMGTAIFAIRMGREGAYRQLQDPIIQRFYKNYADSGIKKCPSSNPDHTESYNEIVTGKSIDAGPVQFAVDALTPNLRFVLRGINRNNHTATTMLRSCVGEDGNTYETTNLHFNFSARIFVSVEVDFAGKIETRALYMNQVAAVPSLPNLSGAAYSRFISGEYDRKLLLEAWHHGWPVR